MQRRSEVTREIVMPERIGAEKDDVEEGAEDGDLSPGAVFRPAGHVRR